MFYGERMILAGGVIFTVLLGSAARAAGAPLATTTTTTAPVPDQDRMTPRTTARAMANAVRLRDLAAIKRISVRQPGEDGTYALMFDVAHPTMNAFAAALADRFGDAGRKIFGGSEVKDAMLLSLIDRADETINGDNAKLDDPHGPWEMAFERDEAGRWLVKAPPFTVEEQQVMRAKLKEISGLTERIRKGEFQSADEVEALRDRLMMEINDRAASAGQPSTAPAQSGSALHKLTEKP